MKTPTLECLDIDRFDVTNARYILMFLPNKTIVSSNIINRPTYMFSLETSQKVRMGEVHSTQLAVLELAQRYEGIVSSPVSTVGTLLTVKFKER